MKDAIKGIVLSFGKKKSTKTSDDETEEEKSPDSESGESDELFGDAFDAIKDGDREGFIRLMKEACKDCME
jgi:hypothetical protein